MPGTPPPPPGTTIPVDAVPTSVVRGPDGSLYVGQLTGFPFVPGAASVFRIPPGGGAPEVVATGFTMITDLAVGRDGTLYVVEFSTQSLLAGPAPGALIRVRPDGTRDELAAGRLVTPAGIVLGHGAAYVSNHGAEPGTGEVLRIPLG
jgi:sugar lactone lactonase YvrE